MVDRVNLRGLKYRVVERDIDGKTQWVAQHRTKYDAWEDCHDDRGELVARDHPSFARHWFFWEDGATKYPDAGQGRQHVYRFRKDGTRIPEDDELKAERAEQEMLANADARMEKLAKLKQHGIYPTKRELFVCDCNDISHQFVINLDSPDEDWQFVSVEIKLNRNLPWWKRLWVAFKYVFCKYPCRFGDFDEVLLGRKHAPQLQKVVDELLNLRDEENSDD